MSELSYRSNPKALIGSVLDFDEFWTGNFLIHHLFGLIKPKRFYGEKLV